VSVKTAMVAVGRRLRHPLTATEEETSGTHGFQSTTLWKVRNCASTASGARVRDDRPMPFVDSQKRSPSRRSKETYA
jgi:hypothetical protein